jgi:hypothetical protein
MNDSTGTDQGMNMNAADAAAIMAEAGARARRTLRPDHRVTLTLYGVIWFLGDGLMWLLVSGKHRYHGVNSGGYAATVLLSVLVSLTTAGQVQAETGLRGLSVVRRWTFFLTVLAGFGGAFALEGALVRAGAGRPVVGVLEAVLAVCALAVGPAFLLVAGIEQRLQRA